MGIRSAMLETILIPDRMKRLPRDARGYPVPFVQLIYDDGTPDFRTLDAGKLIQALRRKLCGLCGVALGKHIYFLGGPKCVEYGHFYDPPMHRDCALFALQTCPHLARSKGKYAGTEARGDIGDAKLIVGEMDTTKSEWFGLMHTTAFDFGRTPEGMLVVRAKLPWLDVERWKDGVQIGVA